MERDLARAGEVLLGVGALDVALADTPAKQNDLWRMRRSIGEAVRKLGAYVECDTAVPPTRVPDLLRGVREVAARFGIRQISYGHAGDGNIHCNVMRMGMDEATWNERLPGVVEEIFRLTVSLGGMISGEHGIGWSQRRYLPLALPPAEIEVMRAIKRAFDPLGILNPDKMLPE